MAKGIFWSMAGAIISRGLMLIASILVARILGREIYGEFGMIRSTVNMFVIFAGFGLGLTATKHVAQFRQNDPERAGRIIALSGIFALVTGTLVTLAIILFAPWLATKTINAPHLVPELRIGAFILLINGLNGAQTGALAGFEAFKTIAKVNLGVGLSSFPLLIAGTYWGGLRGAIWALLVNVVVNWLLNHFALRIEAKKNGVPFSSADCLREWPILWKFSLPSALSGFLVSPVLWACNAFLVNQPGGYAQMGLFDAANQWRMAVLFIPGMVGRIAMPILSNLVADKDHIRYRKVLKYNVILNGGAAFAVAVPISLFASPVMQNYGRDFEEGKWVLVCLVFSATLMSINDVVGQAIASLNRMWVGFSFNLLWAIALIITSYWFVNQGYGALGLAFASIFAYLLHSVWQCYFIFHIGKIIKP